MSGRNLGRLLAASLLLCTAVAAQPDSAKPEAFAGVRLINTSDSARRDVITTVVSFAGGTYDGGPLVLLDGPFAGTQLQHRRFGGSWPDGSVRYAIVHLPARLGPKESVVRSLGKGRGAAPAFSLGKAIVKQGPRFGIALRVGRKDVTLGPWQVIESGHLMFAIESRRRVPDTPVWVRCVIEYPTEADHARFWLHYGDSDPGDPKCNHDLPAIHLFVWGAEVELRHNGAKNLGKATSAPDYTVIKLEHGSRWRDGESQAIHGVLTYPKTEDTATRAAVRHSPIFRVATNWPQTKALGPWSVLPGIPPDQSDADLEARARDAYDRHKDGDPWEAPRFGMAPRPANAGDQEDFSAMKLLQAANGYPGRLIAVQRSVLAEACRPTHFRNADATPVAIGANPRIWLWEGIPDPRFSPELLGKPKNEPRGKGHGTWRGRDRQHWSCLNLTHYALLTGDRFALDECAHLAELWLGEMRTTATVNPAASTGNPTLDGMGNSRDVGRTLHSGTMLWLVTGRPDLERRIRERVQVVAEQWPGRDTSPVRPLYVGKPDPRVLEGKWPAIRGWMEAIGIRGLDAVAQVFDDATARRLVWETGVSFLDHCVWEENGAWGCCDGLAWLDGGKALSGDQLNTMRKHSTTFNAWAAPACIILAREAAGRSDEARKARALALLATVGNDWRSWEWKAVK